MICVGEIVLFIVVMDSIDPDSLPPGVTVRDCKYFARAQKDAKEQEQLTRSAVEHGRRYPPSIEFGKYELQTWYSSPYPQEYAQ